MLGRYAFVLPDTVVHGELRPLRNPSLVNDDEAESNFRFRSYRSPHIEARHSVAECS
jgi:hypothetical protein